MTNLKRILTTGIAALSVTAVAAGCTANTTPVETTTASSSISSSATGIINDYNNTEELSKMFPVINETPIESDMEKKIQNRLLTGFANWNQGYDAWIEWGDILYTKDSMYNLHGIRLTLEEYQNSQKLGLAAMDIQMGDFQNMIICDDWTAIRYDISSTNRESGETTDGTVMEFVNFKDYGDELGTRVVEGWASTRGEKSEAMTKFQTEEEQAAQNAFFEEIENYELPNTKDLSKKYIVKNETPDNSDIADEIRDAILNDFEQWNQGYSTWADWADSYYDNDLEYTVDGETLSLKEYKASVKNKEKETTTTRLYFDNMLISGDWAAIHYRTVEEDVETGEKTAKDVMQFLHFEKSGDTVKVMECWTK